jgi:uncharacterized coiled-coil protein SlyX
LTQCGYVVLHAVLSATVAHTSQAVSSLRRELEAAYERLSTAEAEASEARASAGRSATLALEMGRLQEDNAVLAERLEQMANDLKCVSLCSFHNPPSVCIHAGVEDGAAAGSSKVANHDCSASCLLPVFTLLLTRRVQS